MPRIFDNIEKTLLPALQQTIEIADRADFCVGYFNLRGWKQLDSLVDRWGGGDGHCCRLLVGMQASPEQELREAMRTTDGEREMDNQTALRLKKRLAEEFRDQLATGLPTGQDEVALRRLAAQIKAGKVVVKLFLRHRLHAKLYLLFRPDPINPVVGYLGSSNLTFAGLVEQGELNVDVLDGDACHKLVNWFEDRWNDRWCIDISKDLVSVIDESWAREDLIPPYHIYVKMAYHLSQEARAGLTGFRIPRDFGDKLFEFQTAAVKIAAHHLNKRGGVVIGDVVGLGKTLMATALARIFEDDYDLETLILCPKNLERMWTDYRDQYRLRARVLPVTQVIQALPNLRRYRLVVIDESHNLRNREGRRYRAIQEYVQENESKCILLSATPYNKTYLDLSNQLRLFVPEHLDLGVRPERLLQDLGEAEFIRRHQCSVRSLAAFEKSEYPDDWRELMRLFMVRRTRSFIQANYAEADPETGRKYLTFQDGTRSYFPTRAPKTVKFAINDRDPDDQYARLYAPAVVDTINALSLPRYGLGNYVNPVPGLHVSPDEDKTLQDLGRAGKRLMGFCRTNLFKRLESSGQAFIQSIERHILRNFIYLRAIDGDLHIPIGPQEADLLDTRVSDEDSDAPSTMFGNDNGEEDGPDECVTLLSEEGFRQRAADVYADYASHFRNRFKWLRPGLFTPYLREALMADASALLEVLRQCGEWDPARDTKLQALRDLLVNRHANEKVIVFTQFADTVRYLDAQLKKGSTGRLEGVTGQSSDPTWLAWRFSPQSNGKRDLIRPEDELRVLIATDVLSEGQNLQDCYIVVNYDLPWAIIRLIQRAGRVDRIGQQANTILCYSFLPADGVERIIRLRERVRKRLEESAEVVGTDEEFFEGERGSGIVRDIYNERAGIMDDDEDTEVDLASYAYQIWKNAITANPRLEQTVPALPNVVYSTRAHVSTGKEPEGALVYLRTGEGADALAWIDKEGRNVTQSQLAILRAAECRPDTPALPRQEQHHELVKKGVELVANDEKLIGGALGRPSGARFRTYERLKRYVELYAGTMFDTGEVTKAIDDIYRYPLRPSATDTLNRQLRAGVHDEELARLVVDLRKDGRLCIIEEEESSREPQIICSMGLAVGTRGVR